MFISLVIPLCCILYNRICSQTVSVLACSVGDHGIEPRSDKTKAITWVHVAFLLRTQHYGEKVKTGWLGIRIMCQEWSDMCTSGLLFSELLYKNLTKRVGHHYYLIEM